MRPLVLALLCALPLAGGCGVDCGSPQEVDGRYAVFASVLEVTDLSDPEAFPSYMTPANGWTEWRLDWGGGSGGKNVIELDEQTYEGTGSWDPVECGHFTLDFSGTYASVNETEHLFQASGEFVVFGPNLEGVWDWSEEWTNRRGDSGTFAASGQLTGQLLE